MRLLLVGCSTAAALMAGEFASRRLGLSKTWSSYLAERELNLAAHITPDPVGFRRPPGTTWKMPGGFVFGANEAGFRDRPFSIAKAPGTVRIAFLGDSVTEGYGVEERDRFSNTLITLLKEKTHTSYEGLNFGVAGQSTADEYVVLTRDALKYEPDVVVLQVGWNDFAENVGKLPVVRGESSRVSSPPPAPTRSLGLKSFLQAHSALYLATAERLAVLRLRRGGPNPILSAVVATTPEAWDATRELVEMFIRACRDGHVRPVVAYFPLDVEVLTADPVAAAFASNHVRDMAKDAGATFIDILSALRADHTGELYIDDVHLTRAGNRIAAERLAEYDWPVVSRK